MGAVDILRPANRNRGTTGRAVLISGTDRVELPIAPREGTHDGDAPTIAILDRPGRRPLTKVTGAGLRVYTFTELLAYDGLEISVEDVLGQVRRLASNGRPVVFQHGSQLEAGVWRISRLTSTVLLREEGTNKATRVELSVELTEATDVELHNGPASGGHRDNDRAPGHDKPRSYTWRHGDTPTSVSRRFYGEPGRFGLIANANGIRHPHRIKPGRRLTIPRRS